MKHANLMCVKSIVTILLIATICILAILKPEEYGDTLESLAYIIVTFYFTHQIDKKNAKEGDKNERD